MNKDHKREGRRGAGKREERDGVVTWKLQVYGGEKREGRGEEGIQQMIFEWQEYGYNFLL